MENGMKQRPLNQIAKFFKIAVTIMAMMLLQACVSGAKGNFSPGYVGTGKKIALVVGNNNYREITPLENPTHDATDISQALKNLGFEVTLKTDVTKSGLAGVLKEFGQKAQRANVALFYFSGHGLQVNGENILAPVDYTLEKPEKGASANEIQKIMQDATNGTKLIILDACRNNPFIAEARTATKSVKRSGKKSRVVGKGLAPMIPLKEFIVMYSTAAGETASDGNTRNSPYTTALLQHINEPIPIETLFKRVTRTVQETTEPPQLPANYTAGLTSDFCFTGCGVEIANIAQTCRINIGKGIYEGECEDGKANGKGVQRYADGEYYTGDFKDNLRHGYGRQYLTDGTEISGYWEKGRLARHK